MIRGAAPNSEAIRAVEHQAEQSMQEGLDLRVYWPVFLKWWWIFVLASVGGGLAGFLLTRGEIPIYQATAKVFVQGRPTPGALTPADVQASLTLATHYSDLVQTRPIMERVTQQMSLPYGAGTLDGKTNVITSGSFIEIQVKDPSSTLAAEIANAVANVFIDDVLVRQLTQMAQFQASLSQYGIAADLNATAAAQLATLTTLTMIEEALPPTSPSPSTLRRSILVGVMIGIVAAGLLVFVLEYLDDSVSSPDELQAITGLTALGIVPIQKGVDAEHPVLASAETVGRNPLNEPYNYLRTNLEFAAAGYQGMKAILVTSAGPSEGKTTTSVNLAISLAREGKSVVLVDSDLRRPSVHRIFGESREPGLTRVVLGTATLEDALISLPGQNLKLLASGPLPPDPIHVIRAPVFKAIIEELKASSDVVILDSSPLLAVADALVLAPMVDGVVMVVAARSTRRRALRSAVESLRNANPNVLGAVLNKVGGRRSDYYYYYYSQYDYYPRDGERANEASKNGLGLLPASLRKAFRRRTRPLATTPDRETD